MKDTIVGDGWRWAIVALGFLAALSMAFLLRIKVRTERKARDAAKAQRVPRKRDPLYSFEVAALIGGTAVCFFVATGTLGVILHLDSVFRLPFMATALAYSVFGRGGQLLYMWRKR